MLALCAAFAAVYLIWGSTYLGIHYAIQTLPPLLMAGLRFSLAGALVYASMRVQGDSPPTPTQWKNAAIVGGLLLCGGNGLICIAQQRVPTGIAALLVATVPLWMVLIDWVAFRGRRPAFSIGIGLALGLLGVLVLVDPWKWQGEPIHLWSALAVLIACVSWSIGSLFSRRANLPKSVFLSTGMQMLGGGALLLIAGTLRGEWSRINLDSVSWQSIVAFAYLVMFGSIIGYSAYIWLLQNVSAAAVSTYAYVNPIVAVALGWLFLREPIGMNTLIAGGLILAAVVLITARRRKPVETAAINAPKPIAISELKRGVSHAAREPCIEQVCDRI